LLAGYAKTTPISFTKFGGQVAHKPHFWGTPAWQHMLTRQWTTTVAEVGHLFFNKPCS